MVSRIDLKAKPARSDATHIRHANRHRARGELALETGLLLDT
jgi:hypothetical protein